MHTKFMEKNNIILINNFVVDDPYKQQKVADMLEDASKQILSKHDGFISTRIHKNYVPLGKVFPTVYFFTLQFIL